jgi:predicted amidohydrolase YtcJ
MHVSYNENITPFLDAMEEMNRTVPLDGLKWSIEHAETITPENIARVKALGGGIALDPKMALHGDGFIKTYSREKALETPRLRQLVDSGIPLALTTDAYRASTFNPWVAMYWAVSGTLRLRLSGARRRQSALPRRGVEAVHAWRRVVHECGTEMGMIAPGNLAISPCSTGTTSPCRRMRSRASPPS